MELSSLCWPQGRSYFERFWSFASGKNLFSLKGENLGVIQNMFFSSDNQGWIIYPIFFVKVSSEIKSYSFSVYSELRRGKGAKWSPFSDQIDLLRLIKEILNEGKYKLEKDMSRKGMLDIVE